jgi:thioredoxin reductase
VSAAAAGAGAEAETAAERADVVIVGGGPAGLSAAAALRALGADRVVVIERERVAGGVPRHCGHTGFGLRDLGRSLSGPEYARRLADRAASAGAEVRTGTQVTGWRDPHVLELTGPAGRSAIVAGAVVLATGCRARPRSARLIAGTRAEGVMTTGMLQQLVHLNGVRLGGRAVIVGAEHVSYSALATVAQAGARTLTMVTDQPRHQSFAAFAIGGALRYGARLRTRTVLSEIHGTPAVEAVTLTDLDGGPSERVACELVVLTADWIPDHELAVAAGVELDPLTRGPRIDGGGHTNVRGVFAAGNVVQGAEPADVAAMQGRDVANAVGAHLAWGEWPVARVPVIGLAPLQWVVPGAVVLPSSPPRAVRLRAREYLLDAQIVVAQGDHILHRQRLARVMPGRSSRIDGAWAAAVDPAGPPVSVRVASARRRSGR